MFAMGVGQGYGMQGLYGGLSPFGGGMGQVGTAGAMFGGTGFQPQGYPGAQQAMGTLGSLMQSISQAMGGGAHQSGFMGPHGHHMNHGANRCHGHHGHHGRHGQGQGGAIELQKGQSFTTPGGATIDWQGDEVKIHERGGGTQSMGGGQGMGGSRGMGGGMGMFGMMMGQFGGGAFAMAFGGMFGMGNGMACKQTQERDWKVWGDPHKTNPDGSQSGDFSRKNGMFTLQDGTRVVMEANGPQGVVEKVKIFPPGAELEGFDKQSTTNYTDNDGDGKWDENGNQTVAEAEQMQGFGGGYGGGFGNNPYGGW